MKIVERKIYNKRLERSFDESFQFQNEGEYLFEITASAKSWWQNALSQRSFLRKDSLTILLNGKPIEDYQKERKLLADDLWNGNTLKGNDAIILIAVLLPNGKTKVSFVVHGQPFLKEVKVYSIPDGRIEYAHLTPSKRDRIPWMSLIVTEKCFLQSISVIARATISGGDDDDLQIWIDDEKQKNNEHKVHRDWYWCGKTLKGSAKTFQKEFKEDEMLSRINFIADGSPMIDELVVMCAEQTYVDEVYAVYLSGVDKRKRGLKLWSIGILLFMLLLGGSAAAYAYQNNGYFWLSNDSSNEEGVGYILTLNEIRGIVTKKTPIATQYANGGDYDDIRKDEKFDFYPIDLDQDGELEIVVEGTSSYRKIAYVLTKKLGEWIIVPNSGEPPSLSGPSRAFTGHDISFQYRTAMKAMEVKESHYIGYINALDEVRHSWYRYDPVLKGFIFVQKNIVPVKDGASQWSAIASDPIHEDWYRRTYSE